MKLILVAGILMLPQLSAARPCGTTSADYIFDLADLVIKGVQLSRVGPERPEGDSKSVIRIWRVIKGTTSASELTVMRFVCDRPTELLLDRGAPIIAFIKSGELIGNSAIIPASNAKREKTVGAREAFLEELLLALEDKDPQVSRFAVTALVQVQGKDALPTLRSIKPGDFGTRFRVLAMSARFGDADALTEMISIIEERRFDGVKGISWTYNEAEEPLHTAYWDFRAPARSYRTVCETHRGIG